MQPYLKGELDERVYIRKMLFQAGHVPGLGTWMFSLREVPFPESPSFLQAASMIQGPGAFASPQSLYPSSFRYTYCLLRTSGGNLRSLFKIPHGQVLSTQEIYLFWRDKGQGQGTKTEDRGRGRKEEREKTVERGQRGQRREEECMSWGKGGQMTVSR